MRELAQLGGASPKDPGGMRQYYLYDGADVALVVRHAGTDWWVTQRFMSGGVDQPLVGRFKSGDGRGGRNVAFVTDRQGTTLAAVQPNGEQDGTVAYFGRNAFGKLEGGTTAGSTNTEVGFTGASTPNQTGGFTYLRNRWYDPQSGRFLTQDPIGLAGGVNLYAYAGNNPVSFSDPYGLCPIPPSSCVRGIKEWGMAIRMTAQWASGTGPGNRTFVEGSPQVESMKAAGGVGVARDLFNQKNADAIKSGGELQAVTNVAAGFGPGDVVAAGANGTEQFVGSYRVDVTPSADGATAHFVVSNTTSMTSASYHALPSWERSTFGPGGNMRQTYEWDEPVEVK